MRGDRLDSWKEIADYLDRDIKTCFRWERDFGLPVHRINNHSPRSKVYAFKTEIDQWLRHREKAKSQNNNSLFRRRWLYIGFLAVIIPLLVYLAYSRYSTHKNSRSPSSGLSSIAVLPVSHSGPKEKFDYLSKGITRVILDTLSAVDRLKVISVEPDSKEKITDRNLVKYSNGFDADYLLKGSLETKQNEAVLCMKLFRKRDKTVIWSQNFNNPKKNVTRVIESIISQMAELLNIHHSQILFAENFSNHRPIDNYLKGRYILDEIKISSEDPWELYHKGKFYSGRCTPESNEMAIEYFYRAIQMDNDFSLPYLGLVRCYSNYVNFGWDFRRKWIDKAKDILGKLRSFSCDLPEYYATSIEINLIEMIDFHEKRKNKIAELVQEGLNKYPHHRQLNSIAGYWYFTKFGESGDKDDFNKALEYKEKSFFMDPYSIGNIVYAELLMLNREFHRALEVCKIVEKNVPSSLPKFRLGEIYYYLGELEKSREIFNQLKKDFLKKKIEPLLNLAMISSQIGEKRKSLNLIEEVELLSPECFIKNEFLKISSVYFGLGMKEKGYKYLDSYFNQSSTQYSYHTDLKYIEIDKNFNGYRNEEKFQKIIKRENFN